jgi:hypothetical protein
MHNISMTRQDAISKSRIAPGRGTRNTKVAAIRAPISRRSRHRNTNGKWLTATNSANTKPI